MDDFTPQLANAPPPPAAPRPKKGFPWLLLLVGLFLLGSLGLNLVLGLTTVGLAAKQAANGSPEGYQEVLVDGDAKSQDVIAILPIQGVILDIPEKGMVASLQRTLRHLKKVSHLKAIILDVDSPGGGVTASDTIYHEIDEFKKAQKVPVVALFGDVAASGGYYVSMAADHIVAHETTITGSIGVISHFYNFTGLMSKVGMSVKTVKSLNSQGKESFKDIGSPYRPMRPEEEKLMQGLITEMWGRFTRVVAEGRKGKLTLTEVQNLADGKVFTGPQALKAKLIDSLGYREEAYAKARELASAPDAKVVQYKKIPGLEDFLSGFGADSHLSQLNSAAPDLPGQGPRFMYLWMGR